MTVLSRSRIARGLRSTAISASSQVCSCRSVHRGLVPLRKHGEGVVQRPIFRSLRMIVELCPFSRFPLRHGVLNRYFGRAIASSTEVLPALIIRISRSLLRSSMLARVSLMCRPILWRRSSLHWRLPLPWRRAILCTRLIPWVVRSFGTCLRPVVCIVLVASRVSIAVNRLAVITTVLLVTVVLCIVVVGCACILGIVVLICVLRGVYGMRLRHVVPPWRLVGRALVVCHGEANVLE